MPYHGPYTISECTVPNNHKDNLGPIELSIGEGNIGSCLGCHLLEGRKEQLHLSYCKVVIANSECEYVYKCIYMSCGRVNLDPHLKTAGMAK